MGAPVVPGSGVSVLQVQQIAQKVLDSLGLGSIVQFQVERNPAAAGISVPQGVVPTGGTSNGKVYAFSDNIANEAEAFKVIFHELFHLGLSQSVKQGHQVSSLGLLSPTSNGPKPTKKQVQALVDRFQKLSNSRLPITVDNSPSEVNGLEVHIPVGAKPMGGVIEGKIYIFTDNLPSNGDAVLTVFHALFHHGSKVRFDRLHCF